MAKLSRPWRRGCREVADDAVVGFEHRDDAERFWSDLRGRLAEFSLELNAEKTRLIQFGRFAAQKPGEGGSREA